VVAACVGSAWAQFHPRDPWVFRCEVEDHPRAIVVALSPEMWVAYDPVYCRVFKVWKGGLDWGGPAFNVGSNVAPKLRVDRLYFQQDDPDVWSIREGKDLEYPPNIRFKGYTFKKGNVVFKYTLELGSEHPIDLREELSYYVDPKGHLTFQRRFDVTNIPPKTRVVREFRGSVIWQWIEGLGYADYKEITNPSGVGSWWQMSQKNEGWDIIRMSWPQ